MVLGPFIDIREILSISTPNVENTIVVVILGGESTLNINRNMTVPLTCAKRFSFLAYWLFFWLFFLSWVILAKFRLIMHLQVRFNHIFNIDIGTLLCTASEQIGKGFKNLHYEAGKAHFFCFWKSTFFIMKHWYRYNITTMTDFLFILRQGTYVLLQW